MLPTDRLMDFKPDILINIPSFLSEIAKDEQINLSQEASLNAFKRFTSVKQRKNSAQPQLYCRMCYLAKMPREIFVSHNIGDEKVPSYHRRTDSSSSSNTNLMLSRIWTQKIYQRIK